MKVAIIVPNWNGADFIANCLASLENQTLKPDIVVVDNGSDDSSVEIIEKNFPQVRLIKNPKNLGFAGGVNIGLSYALDNSYEYAGLFNNDAVAEKTWVEKLVKKLEKKPELGAIAGKLLKKNGKTIDSTGDLYSAWGLPIARQRNEKTEKAASKDELAFGATAGACIYRAQAVKDVGLFDEKFFAYYEDTDFNFRLQLRGWKVFYTPDAVAYHAIGSTSGRLSGFTTYQTLKNLPMLFFKNVPFGLMPRMLPRFFIAYYSIFFSSIFNGRAQSAFKGHLVFLTNIPHVLIQRRKIQKVKRVDNQYLRSIIYDDLPPDAYKLRRLRRFFTGKP